MVLLQQFASSFASVASTGKQTTDIANKVAASATALDYRRIIDSISDDVDVVMIGEASHGNTEFYQHRAEISKLLMLEKGFNLIGLESDFPDTYRVNQYATNHRDSSDKTSIDSLGDFERFPMWMWRNEVMVQFVDWLRKHNDSRPSEEDKCELFGMDVYSLEHSRDAVLSFLTKYDPELPGFLELAEDAYLGSSKRRANIAKAEKVVKALERYLAKYPNFEELFIAVQNARCVKGAAEYYTASNSWNYRDTFMFETIKRMMNQKSEVHGRRAKTIIWAHNSHLGDSRHTYKQSRGEITVGKLIRDHWGMDRTSNIGFTNYDGFVTATDEWGIPCTYKKVNNGMSGSVEKLFHEALLASPHSGSGQFMITFRATGSQKDLASSEVIAQLGQNNYLERAIGVIYRPDTERRSHYFDVRIAKQFDVVIHIDRTSALVPLDIPDQWAQNKRFYSS